MDSMSTRRFAPLTLVLILALGACQDSPLEGSTGSFIGNWLQVNFLAIDDRGVWDADDLSGIGFAQSISDTEWVLTDTATGCAITFSYSVTGNNRFTRRAIRAGNRCPAGFPLARWNDSGRLQFSEGGRFMFEYYDLQPGDDIVAFKFVRR